MTLRQRLLDFLSAESDDIEPGEAPVDDEPGDEQPADEIDEPGDEQPVDEPGDEPGDEPADGGVEEPAEVAELRQTITEQGALIETLRNQVAELGGVPIEDELVDDDTPDEPADEDVVDEFEKDYAEREARLAELTKDN